MNAKLNRRDFLKLAVSTALLASATPTPAQDGKRYLLGEIGGKPEIRQARVVPVLCMYCGVICNLLAYVHGDKILFMSADPASPINAGRACPKGLASHQQIDNQLRALFPMIRTGPKPPPEEILNAKSWEEVLEIVKKYPPKWRTVSWDEALDFIAQKLTKILREWRDKTGQPKRPDGYYYTGASVPVQVIGSSTMVIEGAYLSKKLATYLGSANMDSQYRKCHSSTVASLAVTFGWGIETGTFEDFYNSDVILFFSSPAEAHPVSTRFFLEAKRRRGTILIVFDPRFSRTAMIADIWVPFRSGSETAIFNYILHYAFFERNPPIDKLEEFKRLMNEYWNAEETHINDLKEMLKEYTAEEVSRITGVPVDLLRLVAKIYVENSGVVTNHKKHGSIQWAMGMTQHTKATVSIVRAASLVNILLGNVPYPGGGLHPFRGWANVQGSTDVQGAGNAALPGYHGHPVSAMEVRLYQDWKLQGFPDPWQWEIPEWALGAFPALGAVRGKGQVNFAKAMQWYKFYGWRRMELTWGVFCGTDPETDPEKGTVVCDFPFGTGSTEITFIRRVLNGEIKATFIFGENLAVTNPNARLTFAALSALDLLVVSDLFETETAWFADVFLPAASFAEHEGNRVNTSTIIMWSYKAVEPRGHSRPDYWIIAKIADRLYRSGAIMLPSMVYGKKSEKVAIRKGSKMYELYERPVNPMMSWDYSGGIYAATPIGPIEAEVNPRLITKEINFSLLIYDGIYNPVKDEYTSMRRNPSLRRPGDIDGTYSQLFNVVKDWGWSWPQNVRIRYTRDAILVATGKPDRVYAAGKEWLVTGETGEIIDEYTGEYRPAYVPGHSPALPRAAKRRLSGIADIWGGLNIIKFIRTNVLEFPEKSFLIEENGEVKAVSYDEFVAKTKMKYLWANDTLYWDEEATCALRIQVVASFFPGGSWSDFKPHYEEMRNKLKEYYATTRSYREALRRYLEELRAAGKRWYHGYDFRWPIHAEPAESPDVELAIKYPSIAWIHSHNLLVLEDKPDVVRGKNTGVALVPDEVPGEGELVVMTSHRLTEHHHSGALTRNLPWLAQLVPEPFVIIPKALADKIGVKSGDYVQLITLRGSVKMRAWVREAQAYLDVMGKKLPVVNVVWAFSFQGGVTGPQGNLLPPDAGDVVTTIQESKAWIGRVRKA